MTIKLKSLLEENNILVPRNLDSRIEKQKRIDYQRIQEYVENGSKGSLDLSRSYLTKLPDNLTEVRGDLFIQLSFIEDLNNLEYVRGNLMAYSSKLKSLPHKLNRIGWDLYLEDCPINNIDNMLHIGHNLSIVDNYNIDELPEWLEIDGALFCRDSSLSKRFPDKPSLEEYLKERNIIVKGGIFI